MKNKILTFTNLLAFLGVVTIFLFFIPAFKLYRPGLDVEYTYYNLFIVVFGGQMLASPATNFVPCVALIFATIFVVIGIACNILANKFKWMNYFGFLFYAAAGILFLCGEMIVKNVNIGAALSTGKLYWYGGIIAVGSTLCSISFITLLSALVSTSKPKAKETY